MLFGDFGHRARRLAGGKNDQPPARRRLRQVAAADSRRVGGSDRAAKERFQESRAVLSHAVHQIRKRRMARRKPASHT